ncbi:MAG: hypothetical protein WCP91_02475, partial [Candidatus Berkelbacteria bacterium]
MKTYSALLVVALFALMALSLAGCGGSGPVAPPAGIPSGGTIVTDNPTQTMGFADVQSLARGTGLKVRLNRAGYEVREYPCAYIAAFTDSGMKLVECQMPDNVTIGEGDSGSPVLYNGKTIGGLAYGMDGDHKDFWAKSIEDMTPIAQLANVGGLQLRAIGFSHFCNVSDHVAQVITSLGHGGEQLFANRPTTSLAQIHTCGGVPESAPAIAGQSVSVDFCRGPIVNLCIIGTLT